MKTTVFILVLSLFSLICKSQVTLENTYAFGGDNWAFYITTISNNNQKYYFYDRNNNLLNIYNLNHSIYKVINIPNYSTNFKIYYVTESLFDTDNKIEYIYLDVSNTMSYNLKILNEDGNILLDVDSISYVYNSTSTPPRQCIFNTSSGTKLILNNIDESHVYVYSLSGTLPLGSVGIKSNESNVEINLSDSYPNPSNNTTRIDYKLPQGINSAEIVFYNLSGQELKRFNVDNSFNTLELNNSDLPAGTYLYHLMTKNSISSAKKMIVVK